MFATARKAVTAYADVGVETGVASADPHRLILMLFDGAMLAVLDARRALAAGNVAAKGKAVGKAIQIIDQGLKASLDVKSGGEIGERLEALYEYMCRRLLLANLRNDQAMLDEVSRLLAELKSAWASIGKSGANGQPTSRA